MWIVKNSDDYGLFKSPSHSFHFSTWSYLRLTAGNSLLSLELFSFSAKDSYLSFLSKRPICFERGYIDSHLNQWLPHDSSRCKSHTLKIFGQLLTHPLFNIFILMCNQFITLVITHIIVGLVGLSCDISCFFFLNSSLCNEEDVTIIVFDDSYI